MRMIIMLNIKRAYRTALRKRKAFPILFLFRTVTPATGGLPSRQLPTCQMKSDLLSAGPMTQMMKKTMTKMTTAMAGECLVWVHRK